MAPPRPGRGSGRAVLAGVRDALERGWPEGLTVLTGEDRYHLDAAQAEILAHLDGGDPSAYGRTVFGDEEVDVARVVGAARARGMFSPRRVVFVRDVAALRGDPDDLESYLADPPDGSYLLVRAVKLDRKRKLHQLLASSRGFLEFETGPASELIRETIEMGRDRGLALDQGGAAFLVEACLSDLHRVASELEKIRSYVGDAANFRVDASVVREVAAASSLPSGWEIADAVLERSTKDALRAARKAIEAGEEPIRIVGGLAWRARTMLQAKALLASGMGRRDVVAAVRAWAFEHALLEGLARYSLAELLAFPARLLRADRELKSASLPGGTILESLVLDLTSEEAR
jgi:DNA polymerase III subunit delta